MLKRSPLVLTLCAILMGCASLPPVPAETARTQWGHLVVVPARYPPESNIRSFAVGKRAGTARGAAVGAGTGVALAGVMASGGALAAVVAPYVAVVSVPVGAASGAVYGSREAISEPDAAALEAQVRESLASLQTSAALARAVVDTAEQDAAQSLPLLATIGPAGPDSPPDLNTLARQGANSVMEVAVTRVGFTGGKRLGFYLSAHVRILRVSDGSSIYEREFAYESEAYDAGAWSANHAALLQAELRRAYANLANSVVEQVFLLTPLPLTSTAQPGDEPHGFDFLGVRYDACGLAWVSPPRAFYPKLGGDVDYRGWNRFPTISGLQPTLAWEAFPREADRHAGSEVDISRISDVRYDLNIWKVSDDAPPQLVYERRGLDSTSHTLEQPLAPDTRYFWSARARFELEGQTRATKWGYFRVPGYPTSGIKGAVKPESSPAVVLGPFLGAPAPRDVCTMDFIPISNYYRFKTP